MKLVREGLPSGIGLVQKDENGIRALLVGHRGVGTLVHGKASWCAIIGDAVLVFHSKSCFVAKGKGEGAERGREVPPIRPVVS